MDESHLKFLSQRAAAGTITQAERDELLSLIAQSLWGLDALDKRIARIHGQLCDQCALKKKSRLAAGLIDAVAGNKLPWIIVGLLLLIIAALLGVDVTPLFGR